jgi:hypothetical protein
MSNHDSIASAAFVIVRPDGVRQPLRVAVAAPYAGDAGEWRCAVWLDGLEPSASAIVGEDALQALGLAWQYLGQRLTHLVTTGVRLEFAAGGEVPLSAYFGPTASGSRTTG